MKQLLANTRSLARKRYRKQPLRLWRAKLGSHSWRAFILNPENKVFLLVGPVAPSDEEAVQALKTKLEGYMPKTSNA